VASLSHLSRRPKSSFFLYTLEPLQAFFAYTFKAAGTGPRLPDAGAEEIDLAKLGEVFGTLHYLTFGLGTTWPGDDEAATWGGLDYFSYFHFHGGGGFFYCYVNAVEGGHAVSLQCQGLF
jgi:hypothetical protein